MEPNCESEKEEVRTLDEETYLSARQYYDQAELELSGRFDKWVLTLSGSALAISITFIDKIAKKPSIETLFWLKFSWACFVLSMLIALFSLLTSQSAIRENRKELDDAYKGGRPPSLKFRRWYSWATNFCNWGSLSAFILGAIFLCIFSFTNIDPSIQKGGSKDVGKIEKTNKRGEEGRKRLRSFESTESEKKGVGTPTPTTSTERKKEIKTTR